MENKHSVANDLVCDYSKKIEFQINKALIWQQLKSSKLMLICLFWGIPFAVCQIILLLDHFLTETAIISLVITFLIIYAFGIINMIITLKSIGKVINALDDCGIILNDAIKELENVRFICGRKFFGYTEKFIVMSKSIIIPFEQIDSILIMKDILGNTVVFNCKNDLIITIGFSFHKEKKVAVLERILRMNQNKLSANFSIETTMVDHSD